MAATSTPSAAETQPLLGNVEDASLVSALQHTNNSEQGNPIIPETSPPDGREETKDAMMRMRARLKYIFPALSIGIFLAAADQTIIVSSYGRIGSELEELGKIAWLATVYLCTTTASQPLYGKLGEVWGRKPCLLFAYSVFGIGALACGLAQDMDQLIAARAVTGVGAGGMITIVSILLSDIVSLQERGIWQGYVNMVFAIGAGLGAPLGGILTDAIGWRWAFLIQTPACAIAIVLVSILLQLPGRDPQHAQKFSITRVDFAGATSLIICIVALLLGLDKIAADDNSDNAVYFWLALSTTFFLVFLWVESKVAIDPLTPLTLLVGREYIGAYLTLAFGNVAWYGVIFYLPLLYQAVGHFSATAAGISLLPGIFSGVIGGFVGGALLKRSSNGGGFRKLALFSYPLVMIACTGVALGAGLFWIQIPVAAIVALLSVSLFVGGLGNGGGMTATLVVVVSVASPETQAVVTACVYLYRQLGATVGLAVISVVFRRVLRRSLMQKLLAAPDLDLDTSEIVRRVSESLDYLSHLPADARLVVEAAYGDACQSALAVCACLSACAIIFAILIRERVAKNSLADDHE